jgi:hypothetical protein
VEEKSIVRTAIEDEGCEIIKLTAGERDQFARAVGPLYDEARKRFGPGIFALVEDA